jgi:hypothetical protein
VALLSSPRTPSASGAGFWRAHAVSIKLVRRAFGILAWGSEAKGAVRTTFIVFDPPALQDNARFVQIAEEFSVQAFIAQLVVKALNMPILPRAPGLDVKRFDLLALQRVVHVRGDKLMHIVAAQVLGCSITGYRRFHSRDDVNGPDRPEDEWLGIVECVRPGR